MRAAIVAVALLGAPVPALAQGPIDLRVGKLEKEMRAVQRRVFPGGAPVEPELVAPGATPAGNAAQAPVAELGQRVDAIERTLATLTGEVEQAANRARQQDATIARLEARLARLEGSTTDTTAPTTAAPAVVPPEPARPAPAPAATTTPRPDATRRALVAAVPVPATGDTAEDAYSYGYRLYAAKLYPEAQAKLKEFVGRYPAHRRASYAQNLLGRAYFDEGKPALAAVALYDSYQKFPTGERAADSLYWLGQALTKLKKPADACKVYAELFDVYGTKMSGDLKARATKGRADARCPA